MSIAERVAELNIAFDTPWEEVHDQLKDIGFNTFDQQNGALVKEYVNLRQRKMEGNNVNGEIEDWEQRADEIKFFDRWSKTIGAVTHATVPEKDKDIARRYQKGYPKEYKRPRLK